MIPRLTLIPSNTYSVSVAWRRVYSFKPVFPSINWPSPSSGNAPIATLWFVGLNIPRTGISTRDSVFFPSFGLLIDTISPCFSATVSVEDLRITQTPSTLSSVPVSPNSFEILSPCFNPTSSYFSVWTRSSRTHAPLFSEVVLRKSGSPGWSPRYGWVAVTCCPFLVLLNVPITCCASP